MITQKVKKIVLNVSTLICIKIAILNYSVVSKQILHLKEQLANKSGSS